MAGILVLILLCGLLWWLGATRRPAAKVKSIRQARGPTATVDGPLLIERTDTYLRIPSRDFFGSYSTSSDGRYTLAWSDDDGLYLLLEGTQLLAEGKMGRPHDGKVSNAGTFVLNDWTKSSGLTGVFLAIARSGEVLIRHRVRANLGECGISDDGAYAACHTLGAANSKDDAKVLVFDLTARALLFKVDVPVAWPERFSFDPALHHITVHCPGDRNYRYTLEGVCLDADRIETDLLTDQLASGYGYPLLDLAYEKLATIDDEHPDAAKSAEVEDLLRRAVTMSLSDNTAANAYRTLGELAERAGRSTDALELYTQALEKNPGVGVKLRIKHLAAELGIPAQQVPHAAEQSPPRPQAQPGTNPYDVVSGNNPFEAIDTWSTKHAPGVLIALEDGSVVWGPRSAREPYVSCQVGNKTEWVTRLPASPRQMLAVEHWIYVIAASHGRDSASVTVLDRRGRALGTHALPGFATRISAHPENGTLLIASADREITKAELILLNGPEVASRCSCKPSYHWMDVAWTRTNNWIVNCRDRLLRISADGQLIDTLTPPPEQRRQSGPTIITLRITENGTVAVDDGGVDTATSEAYALLELSPPVSVSDAKAAFRRQLLEWHPDRNRTAAATRMTTRIIAAYNDVVHHLSREAVDRDGDVASATYEVADFIRDVVTDATTGTVFASCSSGQIYRIEETRLKPHWKLEDGKSLLYSRLDGSTMLVTDDDAVRVLPSDTLVATHPSIGAAFSLHVRGASKPPCTILFSADDASVFIGRSAFEPFTHIRFSKPVRDIAIDEVRGLAYIAAGEIYVARLTTRDDR